VSERIRKITLAPPPREAPVRPAPAISPLATWFLPPLFLASAAAGTAIVLRGPDAFFAWAMVAIFGTGFGWIAVSIFFPATADRRCPQCGEDAIERIDPGATHGLRCTSCGHRDETASAFLIAEEEGPLEEIVMVERGRRPRPVASGSGAGGAAR
jgi:DNA-directed RNA polymerase subunit RPC12/RpoP